MRETRLSGSEGGATQRCAAPTPIGKTFRTLKTRRADRLPLSGPPIACLCYPKSLRYADEMV